MDHTLNQGTGFNPSCMGLGMHPALLKESSAPVRPQRGKSSSGPRDPGIPADDSTPLEMGAGLKVTGRNKLLYGGLFLVVLYMLWK